MATTTEKTVLHRVSNSPLRPDIHEPAHPDVAWTEHDTRGYLDEGPACDGCQACDCLQGDCGCSGEVSTPVCQIDHKPDCDYADCDCIGLSFGYSCLDGGEFLCDDCAEVTDCDCPAPS